MEFIDHKAQLYAERYSSPADALLDELEAYTRSAHPKAHMISGSVQGGLLTLFSRMMAPRRILEIGTFTGYSALCLAKGLPPEGRLHTLELREPEARIAESYFARSAWKDQIILHWGNALDLLPAIQETWDLVFLDADKVHYIDYYQLVLPRLRPGGVILADNVLFHGEVLEEELKSKNARAIQAFNDYVLQDETVEKLLLTVRDGLLLIRKK